MSEKVWHVVHFAEFFEPDEAKRKGRSSPLPFAKWLTSAHDTDAGQAYQRKLAQVKARADGFAMLGVYGEVLRYTAAQSIAVRGYLVDGSYRPASIGLICQSIGCGDASLVRRALRVLRSVGLLELIALPDFTTAVAKDRPPTAAKPVPKARKKVGGRGAAGGRRAAGRRADSGCGTVTVNKEQGTAPSAPGNGEQGTPKPAASADGGRKPRQKRTAARRGRDRRKPKQRTSNADATAPPTPSPPAAAEPTADMPTIADPPPGAERMPDVAPLGPGRSDSPAAVRAPPMAGVPFDGRGTASVFVSMLYPTRQDLVVNGRRATPPSEPDGFLAREMGTFESAWSTVLSLEMADDAVQQVYSRGMREATKIVRKRTEPKKPRGAVWMHWLNMHMKDLVGVRWAQATRHGRSLLRIAR